MFTIGRLLFALVPILALVALSAPAEATVLLHTWVSNGGSDNNSCEYIAPCQTFNGAYGKTAAGGEITCLNSGDFSSGSSLIITKPITINCENSIASNTFADVTIAAILVEITTGVVTLRGLDLDLAGTGSPASCYTDGAYGILFNGGGVLHLQKMKINHIGGGSCGIFFYPSSNATLDITDSDITDNGSSTGGAGIYILPQSGVQANVTITRTQIQGNYFGIIGDGRSGGTIRATIKDSVVSGSTENGITALSSGSSVVFMVDQTEVSGNLAGMFAGGSNAGMLARNTTVFNNTVGLDTTGGGTLYTYGNNSVNGNTTNGAFTGTAALQ